MTECRVWMTKWRGYSLGIGFASVWENKRKEFKV